MSTLLDKMREFNRMVQKSVEVADDYSPMAETLSGILKANVYVAGIDGNMLGWAFAEDPECNKIDPSRMEPSLSSDFRQRLAMMPQSSTGVSSEECLFHKTGCKCQPRTLYIVPVQNGDERLGHIILTKQKGDFSPDETILAEAGAAIMATAVLCHQMERSEADSRQKTNVSIALDSLSFSEMQAISSVFDELGSNEGFLVTSKIADRIGITRSVIVNAMRKLESAGVVESRSLGMKGTYIRIQNRFFLAELAKRARTK